jgi:uncharacterized membrane protein
MDHPASPLSNLRTIMFVVYASFIAGAVIPVAPLIGLIIAVIKRKDAAGTLYESHCTWLIRTFVIGFGAGLFAAILMVIPVINVIGIVLMATTCLWVLYRIIKGGLRLIDGRPVENPQALI